MATDLCDLTALELAEQIGSGAVSPVEVIRAVCPTLRRVVGTPANRLRSSAA